ncbi:MAG: hypothetical protein ABIR70_02350 [Bryobacteraceae bacterium]
MRSVTLLLCGALIASAQSIDDRAVFGVLQRAAPGVKSAIVYRTPVTPDLELVLAVPGAEVQTRPDGPGFVWTENEFLGLFLQDRSNPNLVFTVTLAPGIPDCWARIERATVTDTVLSCTAEKVSMHPSQKFVYDVRAKQLVRRLEFQPFSMARTFRTPTGAVFVGADESKPLAVDFVPGRQPEFQIMTTEAAQSWVARSGMEGGVVSFDSTSRIFFPPAKLQPLRFGSGGRFSLIDEGDSPWDRKLVITESSDSKPIRHELPISTFDAFAAARPQSVQNGNRREFAEFHETIGPHQLLEGRLWFGKTFYDSEGHVGVGGFGYFDPASAKYVLFSPPEIANWSVSAMLVEADAIWLALVHRGEYGDVAGGVLRFDRATETYKHFDTPDRISEIIRVGDRLLLPNHLGIDTIDEAGIHRYFVDKTTDGRLRVVLAEK